MNRMHRSILSCSIALALCVLALQPVCVWAEDEKAGDLIEGRAALQDGFYKIAESRLAAWLKDRSEPKAETLEVINLYCRALDGLGNRQAIRDVVKTGKPAALNLAGTEQAVYAYGYNHYAYWRSLYPSLQLDYGYMGENLTVSELEETKIHVGDIYKLGNAVVQVTKPRQPCFKLGIRFNDQRIIKQFWNTTKSGVYFRILETGKIAKGDEFVLIEKTTNSPSIADVFTSKRA